MNIGFMSCFDDEEIGDCLKFGFASDQSMLEFDLVLWDMWCLHYDYRANRAYRNKGRGYRAESKDFEGDEGKRFLKDRQRRLREIEWLLQSGRSLVVLCPAPNSFRIKSDYLSTGDEIDIYSFLPEGIAEQIRAEVVAAWGQKMSFRGASEFSDFWRELEGYAYYNAYFKSPIGKPILYVRGTEYPVATWLRYGNGNVFLIPVTEYDDDGMYPVFVDAAKKLVSAAKNLSGNIQSPSWSEKYMFPAEATLTNQLQGQRSDLSEILDSISETEREIKLVRKHKVLLYGTGQVLEDEVALILNKIGFNAENEESNRHDITLCHLNEVGVVEVKGVKKSGAEKHAAQLEKWVSEYYAEHGVQPKGFLIVNAFCDIAPSDRTESPFPHQMIAYSKSRNHCLITTTQLLAIFLDVEANPSSCDSIIKTLFETVGVYEGHKNLEDYLVVT